MLEVWDWPRGKDGRRPNLDPAFIREMEAALGLEFIPDGRGDLQATFGPEDVFHYIYAVFHSPTYRERYAEFLRIDFPRVPLTTDRDLFAALCGRGAALVALHLLDRSAAPTLNDARVIYPEPGDHVIERGYPKFVEPDRVYINKTQYFEGVAPDVWDFQIGGYQVLHKWLKDRRGRMLTAAEQAHYKRVVVALAETQRDMEAIDDLIPDWPLP